MKVLHLLNELHPSGMERMLVSGAPYFKEFGVESIVVGQGLNHPYSSALRGAGHRVITIAPIKSVSGPTGFARLVRETQPDVVHIHSEEFFAASVDLAHWAWPRARIVRTFHSYFLATGWWGVKRRAQGLLSDRYVSAFVALSEEMATHERSFGRECEVVGNWVDDRFLSDTQASGYDEGADVVVVGNCAPVKNHEVILDAALGLGLTVAHLGQVDGASAEERRLLHELGASGLLLESAPGDPYPWLRSARVFGMPSRREGFPVALAEAIAMGRRCVVPDIPGFQWAGRYPLVNFVAGYRTRDWGQALQSCVQSSRSGASEEAELLQRQEARKLLSAEIGVKRYVEIYRGGQDVKDHA